MNALWNRKIGLLREILEVSQKSLLLVDLDSLTPLLEQKDDLINRIRELDGEISKENPDLQPPTEKLESEIRMVVEAILENERTLEVRILAEQTQVKNEIREFDRETRVKRYLDKGPSKGARVNLKK